MSAKAVSVSYNLHPPAESKSPDNLPASQTRTFPANKADAEGDMKSYYASLEAAIVAAKEQIGTEMTQWRDAVGKTELKKETSKTMKYGADEEEQDEDDE